MDTEDGTGLWCRWCGKPVKRSGGEAVHDGTGMRPCADGMHVAAATSASPELRAAARRVDEDYGHRWEIDTDFGFFSAVRRGVAGAQEPVTASTEEEFRARLDARESVDYWRGVDDAAREANAAEPQ